MHFYSLAVEYAGLFHRPRAPLHHLSDLFDHFRGNGLTFRHEPQDNLPLFENDSAAQQQVLRQSVILMENIDLKTKAHTVIIHTICQVSSDHHVSDNVLGQYPL